jgi:hypothetical protein
MSMVAYGIGVLPLIRSQLKHEFLEVKQPWYADDAGAAGNFDFIRRHFTKLPNCKKLNPITVISPSFRRVFLSCPRILI